MQIQNIPPWVNIGCTVGVAGFALGRGGPVERFLAVLVLFEFLNTRLPLVPHIHSAPSNLIILLLSLGACLRSRSYWTVWFSATYLLGVVTDVIHLNSHLNIWTFMSAQLVWTHVANAALLWGALAWREPEGGDRVASSLPRP